jgi:hypothetical protein
LIRPRLSRAADSSGNWVGECTILYSKTLFRAALKVQPSGMVEMTDDNPLQSDLPVNIETFVNGVRVIKSR